MLSRSRTDWIICTAESTVTAPIVDAEPRGVGWTFPNQGVGRRPVNDLSIFFCRLHVAARTSKRRQSRSTLPRRMELSRGPRYTIGRGRAPYTQNSPAPFLPPNSDPPGRPPYPYTGADTGEDKLLRLQATHGAHHHAANGLMRRDLSIFFCRLHVAARTCANPETRSNSMSYVWSNNAAANGRHVDAEP